MANEYLKLQKLLLPARLVATVQTKNADGSLTCLTPGGQVVRLIGSAAVGKRVFYEGNAVIGEAPSLPYSERAV